jgi:hypothetical protein
MLKTPRAVIKFKDPFLNMVIKANKSPLLKPVYVKKNKLKKSHQKEKIALPPLNFRKVNKLNLEIPEVRRSTNKTPTFSSTSRLRDLRNYSEIKIIKLT